MSVSFTFSSPVLTPFPEFLPKGTIVWYPTLPTPVVLLITRDTDRRKDPRPIARNCIVLAAENSGSALAMGTPCSYKFDGRGTVRFPPGYNPEKPHTTP